MVFVGQDHQDVKNLRIRQTWLEEETEQMVRQHDFPNKDLAFQSLAVGLLFNIDYNSIEPDEIVDGGQDKQIDVIKIDDDAEQGAAHIHIVQVKNTSGFSSNIVIQMRNGLDWIFERPKDEYETLNNPALIFTTVHFLKCHQCLLSINSPRNSVGNGLAVFPHGPARPRPGPI